MPKLDLKNAKGIKTVGGVLKGLKIGSATWYAPAPAFTGKAELNSKTFGMAVPRNVLENGGDAMMATIASTGASAVRFDFYLDIIMDGSGGLLYWWSVDDLVASARSHGLQVLGVFNGWAPGTQSELYDTPSSRADYATVAGAAADRFKGVVDHWAIHNEPNLGKMTPENYTLVLIEASNAIRNANPDAFIVGANLSGVSAPTSGLVYNNVDWLERMYASGAKGYYDAIGFHPYTYPWLPNDPEYFTAWNQLVDYFRPAMIAGGESHIPVWVTEFGAPTSGGGDQFSIDRNTEPNLVEAVNQYAAKANALSWIKPTFWYTLQDFGGLATDTENWFGLYRPDGTPKDAVAAYKAVADATPRLQPATVPTYKRLQYVGGAFANGASANYNVALNALTGGIGTAAQAGDLVIVNNGFVSTAARTTGVVTAGYTSLWSGFGDDTRDANMSVSYKRLTTAETSVTVRGSTVASNGSNTVVHVWRNTDPTTPIDVTTVGATGIDSRAINPPSITPITPNAMVIAAGYTTHTTIMSGVIPPLGFSRMVQASHDPGNVGVAVMAARPWTGIGAVDPGVFTIGSTSTADSWAAATLVLRPALNTP